MDIVNIFNSSLPCNFTNLYRNYPNGNFYHIHFILKDKFKIKVFNNIANVIFFLEKNCTFDNTISSENLLKSIAELKILKYGFNSAENSINIRYYCYLELIYVLLLKFKTDCCNMDYYINIIDLHSHFLAWSLYFKNIYKLYPDLKKNESNNLFLDDIIE